MKESKDKDKIQHFKKLSRAYSDTTIMMHQAIARNAGLSGTDHKYLGLILQHGKMSAGELSKLTGLSTGAVTGLVDRLEKKKLVERQPAEEDRRKVIVVPNAQEAMNLLKPLFAVLQAKTEKLIASFSDSEIQVIERYFESAIEIMKETEKGLNNKQNI
jgi:DNA-binding MarR family transcriptional regulator